MTNPYSTMDTTYMESEWWAFKELYDKGLIYKDYRSMHICPRCETTLAQAEVEFNGAQIAANADMIGGSLSASSATTESNAAMIAGNSAAMVDLSGNVSANKSTIDDLLVKSASNAASLMKNKNEINERRKAIMENRAGIAANKAKIG